MCLCVGAVKADIHCDVKAWESARCVCVEFNFVHGKLTSRRFFQLQTPETSQCARRLRELGKVLPLDHGSTLSKVFIVLCTRAFRNALRIEVKCKHKHDDKSKGALSPVLQ